MELENKTDKEIFEKIFSNLIDNKIIYHERITTLCEVIYIEITEEGFKVRLKIIKPFMVLKNRYLNIYEYFTSKEYISLGASFDFPGRKLWDGKSIGGPYCPFTLWPNKETIEIVEKLENEKLHNEIYDALWQ